MAALAVKLEDGGPVLYRQTRVGKDGADFELLKLRTMVVGAEKLGAGYAVNEGDPRITKVGRVARFVARALCELVPRATRHPRGIRGRRRFRTLRAQPLRVCVLALQRRRPPPARRLKKEMDLRPSQLAR